MEKRAILAAVLMAGVLMLYQALFLSSPEQPPPPAKTEDAAPTAPTGSTPPGLAPAAPIVAPPLPAGPLPAVPERTAEIETPLYRARVSSAGGALQQWELDYRGLKPMVVPGVLGPLGLMVERPGAGRRVLGFEVSPGALKLAEGQSPAELRLAGEDGFGLRVTQILRFRADSYAVERVILVENRHSMPQSADILLLWTAPITWPADQAERFQGQHSTRVVARANGAIRREELSSVGTRPQVGEGRWIGIESEWYLAAFVPQSPGFRVTEARLSADRAPEGAASDAKPANGKPGETVEVGLRATLPILGPGKSWEGRVLIYVGPKEYDRLKSFGVELEKSIHFGGFPMPQAYGGLPMEWVAVPVLWLMHRIYALTGNYGIAIILLTIITKVLFFPLTLKSMRSMKAMQAIQPQVNALRAKYKNDPQRVQREMMEIYRQHKVNPLGGCLPMVVQIPIFYALYVALSVTVEIQNAPFICFGRIFGVELWICDLAAQDPTYVLPILMGVSMFIQQKMTPVMGDPRQAKIMLMMPVVFTFMFLSLPSGLVLYWTLSNVLQIAQQYYMNRGAKKAERVPARAPKKA